MNAPHDTLYRLMNYFGTGNQHAAGGTSQHSEGAHGQASGHAQSGGGDDDNEVTTRAYGHNNHFPFWGMTHPTTTQGEESEGGGAEGGATTPLPPMMPSLHAPGHFSGGQHGAQGNQFRPPLSLNQLRIGPSIPDFVIRRIQYNIYNQIRRTLFDQVLQCVQEKLREPPVLPSVRNYNFLF